MNNMNRGILPVDFYEITKRLMPNLQELPRMEAMATMVAEVIERHQFVVRYDKMTAPLIDAAVKRNPYDEDDLDITEQELARLVYGEHIILYDADCCLVSLPGLLDAEAEPIEFLTYEELVAKAEAELNDLLRFAPFDYQSYMTFVGAAFAITRADHPDWLYETFIECFRKDVVDKMAERSEDYLGYREFVGVKSE